MFFKLYEYNVFFKYEGKTTGIKNLLFDMLCYDYKIIIQNESVIKKYDKKVQGLFDTIQKKQLENQELGKLDENVAKRNIAHLRRLQEIRDEKIKRDRRRKEEQEKSRESASVTMSELKDRYLNLFRKKDSNGKEINSQTRGYLFEDFLRGLFLKEGMEVTEPFKIKGEQIDGKMYGRRFFISVNGFSSDSVKALVVGKAINTMLVDGEDLVLITEERYTLKELLDSKMKAAQTMGRIYVHIADLTDKIKE